MKGNRFLKLAGSIICLFCFSQQMKAQVSVQDSLALVAIYNKIPALASYGTWLNGNVSTWTGVDLVQNNRVVTFGIRNLAVNDSIPEEICALDSLVNLHLISSQFKGKIPACLMELPVVSVITFADNQLVGIEPGADFSKLANITALYITNNNFTEMPDFLSITNPGFNFLEVRNNNFNFDDLLPILSDPPASFYYDFQRPLDEYREFQTLTGSTFDFPDVTALMGGGPGINYTWKALDATVYTPTDSRFVNVYGPSLRIEGVEMTDNIAYRCEASHPDLPGLVLQTDIYRLEVVHILIPQSITFHSDTFAYCNSPTAPLVVTALGGRPVSLMSLNNDIATLNPDNSLTLHQTGVFWIQASVDGDSVYLPGADLISFTVASHTTIPPFTITEQLPMEEGGDLHLSVPYIPQLTYQWTTPAGLTYDGPVLTVSPFTISDLGSYQMVVTEGTCLHRTLSELILELASGKPLIYELITPNGDGDNETFYIENLNPSLENEVTVFNAVHQVVYHQKNYRNDWDGGGLPVGTYYYLVKIGEETYKGDLYIKR